MISPCGLSVRLETRGDGSHLIIGWSGGTYSETHLAHVASSCGRILMPPFERVNELQHIQTMQVKLVGLRSEDQWLFLVKLRNREFRFGYHLLKWTGEHFRFEFDKVYQPHSPLSVWFSRHDGRNFVEGAVTLGRTTYATTVPKHAQVQPGTIVVLPNVALADIVHAAYRGSARRLRKWIGESTPVVPSGLEALAQQRLLDEHDLFGHRSYLERVGHGLLTESYSN